MNIFILDNDPKKAAEYHNDKHVIKQILEAGQLICTVAHNFNIEAPYKSTHKHHPCTKWLLESSQNFIWLANLMFHLNNEYKLRFGHLKNHKTFDEIYKIPFLQQVIAKLPNKKLTKYHQAVSDSCRGIDAVEAYRKYYKTDKATLATWKYPRSRPYWFDEK